jgi:hypothetical protein
MKKPLIAMLAAAAVGFVEHRAHAQNSVWHEHCYTCTANLADWFVASRDCGDKLAALYMLRCTEACKIAGLDGHVDMLADQAQDCINRLMRPGGGTGITAEDDWDWGGASGTCEGQAEELPVEMLYWDSLEMCVDTSGPTSVEPELFTESIRIELGASDQPVTE